MSAKKHRRVAPEMGLRVLKSWSMSVTMSFLSRYEQLRTQQICVWFYKFGTSRVQTIIRLRWTRQLFTFSYGNTFKAKIISVAASGQVIPLTTTDSRISHERWYPIKVNSFEVFQLKHATTECRMLRVVPNNKYKVIPRADADATRGWPGLVMVNDHVLVIGG